ncbi:hypothetical protein [Pseudarthrobacter sp. PS3-L1]|uniref:hypothetical protein n=1 Tax=Pseudarthrobacter sp. PS3-L1 TaxID=3046207 RepID=UPI0024BADFAF|nr:hypothetical protein [Pseudarthrobacter sp. PS3-L1]MDJ0319150.1 hypothetical protein [Pseudarthrobacter sp. PS3-L1]
MTTDNDAVDPTAPTDRNGVDDSSEASRQWDHIGAIIVDATLQRRQNYHETVKPRVLALIAEWPDAATTGGFRQRLDTKKLSKVIDWPSPGRLAQVEDITRVFESQSIKTVEDLQKALRDHPMRDVLHEALAAVRHVSPKTLNYIDVLSGISSAEATTKR